MVIIIIIIPAHSRPATVLRKINAMPALRDPVYSLI